ncbi:MAG TPA: pitrilysin family protein [Phycisphaerae bacterium]|nr:pitrilysin family protein [Phycisphaerae bacterium]HNU45378.1 pitrilysin family protein [Phycisphaerae bacterium]
MADNPYTLHRLANGLQIVIECMPDVRSVAVGFLVRTGSRDETPEVAGVSHFLEHMMFKGTARRTWRQITVDFDRLGSTYNAYTSAERTIYYGWVPHDLLEPQLELLADMMQSRLPPEEFDTEKNVVLEEIAMSKDQLEHVAMDFLQEQVFAGHPLAWPILGYDHTVGPLSRDGMDGYFRQRYAADNLTLIVTGNLNPTVVIDLADKYCGAWQPAGAPAERRLPALRQGTSVQQVERFKQQIVALACPSVGSADPLAETAGALATILGGENSRFYWNIIQTGISPRAGVFHLDYRDCGLLVLWGACQPENAERLLDAMRAEAAKISTEKVATHEVQRVKNIRRTGLAIEAEAPYHRFGQIVEDMECRGHPRTVNQMLADVDAVSADTIQQYLARCPIDRGGHLVSVGPRAWPAASNC